MIETTPRTLTLTSAAVLLLAFTGAQAATINIAINNGGVGGSSFDYNPRTGNGLLAVASEGYSYSGSGTYNNAGEIVTEDVAMSCAAAGYGSDTCIDGGLNPGLLGYAVEPMADAMAEVTQTITGRMPPHYPFNAYAYANIGGSVDHRVVARAYPAILKPTLDAISRIPVRLDYSLSASAAFIGGHGVVADEVSADCLFRILSDGNALFERRAQCTNSDPSPVEVKGTWTTELTRSTSDQTFLYQIFVYADVDILLDGYSTDTGTGKAQAVVDPFFYVDPTWEYAQYFVVQQESVRNPGEWAELTNEWRNVPDPSTALLMAPAVGLLGRRCRRRTRG